MVTHKPAFAPIYDGRIWFVAGVVLIPTALALMAIAFVLLAIPEGSTSKSFETPMFSLQTYTARISGGTGASIKTDLDQHHLAVSVDVRDRVLELWFSWSSPEPVVVGEPEVERL
jgi:hypothetical protein